MPDGVVKETGFVECAGAKPAGLSLFRTYGEPPKLEEGYPGPDRRHRCGSASVAGRNASRHPPPLPCRSGIHRARRAPLPRNLCDQCDRSLLLTPTLGRSRNGQREANQPACYLHDRHLHVTACYKRRSWRPIEELWSLCEAGLGPMKKTQAIHIACGETPMTGGSSRRRTTAGFL